ncbi:hypothetical protein BSKO_05114 [Bryopsis sp. KO-2023]|nr:hypothetical protein BSKO_05114 [Bryopsis sp. KO-2023]
MLSQGLCAHTCYQDPSSFRRGRNPVGCAKDPHQPSKSNMYLRKEISELEVTLKAKECKLEYLHRRADLCRWMKLQNEKNQVASGEARKESMKRFMGKHSRPSQSQPSSNPPPEYLVEMVKNVCHQLDNTDCLHGAQGARIPDENGEAHAKTCEKEADVDSRSPMTNSNRFNDLESRSDRRSWKIGSHPVPRRNSIDEKLRASDLVEESEPVLVNNAGVQTDKSERCPAEIRVKEVELQAEITKLEAELMVERCMHREAAAENVRLREEKASDQVLIRALREEISRGAEREGELSQAFDQKLKEVEAVKGDYARICVELGDLERIQLPHFKHQLAKIAQERNKLGYLVLERNEQNARLERELGESSRAMLSVRADRDKLEGEKEALIEFRKKDEEELLRTRDELTQQLGTLQTDLDSAKAYTEKMEAASNEKGDQIATLQQQLADATPLPKAEEILAAKKAKEMEETVRKLEDELQKKQTALDQSVMLQKKLLKNADRNPRVFSGLLEEENEMLKQKLIERDMEMDEMKETHQKKASAYEAADENIACLEADIEQWRRDYKGCTKARARLQQENDSMKEELRKLAIECEGSPAKRVQDLKQKLAQERQQSEVLRKTVVDLHEELAEKKCLGSPRKTPSETE